MSDSTDQTGVSIPWLGITSDEYHIPEDFASALAAVVIEWGRFEMTLVSDTSIMMAYPAAQALTDEAPRAFNRKIELWKKCIQAVFPAQESYKDRAREICSKGKIVSKHRNKLIHGMWSVHDRPNPDSFRLVTFRGLQNVKIEADIEVTTEYVTCLRNDIRALNEALVSFIMNRALHGYLKRQQVRREP